LQLRKQGQREGGADGPRPPLVDAPLVDIQNFTNLLGKMILSLQ